MGIKLTPNKWTLYIEAKDMIPSDNNNFIPIKNIEWKLSQDSKSKYKSLDINKQIIANSSSFHNYLELNFRIKVNWLTPIGQYYFPINIYLEESKNISHKQRKVLKRPN